MKPNELREKTTQELMEFSAQLAEEIRALTTGLKTATFNRSHEVADRKRTRARVLTELTERSTITHS